MGSSVKKKISEKERKKTEKGNCMRYKLDNFFFFFFVKKYSNFSSVFFILILN